MPFLERLRRRQCHIQVVRESSVFETSRPGGNKRSRGRIRG